MLTLLRKLLLIFVLLLQVSCGFTPAYKTDKNGEYLLSSVEIAPIATVEGASLFDAWRKGEYTEEEGGRDFAPEVGTLFWEAENCWYTKDL